MCYAVGVLWLIILIVGIVIGFFVIYVIILRFLFKKLFRPRQETIRKYSEMCASRQEVAW